MAFFELENAVNGAAGRGGDGVLQQCGVVASFEDHTGGAFHSLCGQQRGYIARQTDFNSGFGERFKNDVSEGGAAGGEAGDSVHVLFVHHDCAAHGVKHGTRDFKVFGSSVASLANSSHTAADGGGGIGHGANDWNICREMLFQVAGRH